MLLNRMWGAGLDATEKLKAKVGGDSVRCVQRSKDQYGRSVAVCSTPKFELNEWMVKEGLAVAYRHAPMYCGVTHAVIIPLAVVIGVCNECFSYRSLHATLAKLLSSFH